MRQVFPLEGTAEVKAEILEKQAHWELGVSCLVNQSVKGLAVGAETEEAGGAGWQRPPRALSRHLDASNGSPGFTGHPRTDCILGL